MATNVVSSCITPPSPEMLGQKHEDEKKGTDHRLLEHDFQVGDCVFIKT